MCRSCTRSLSCTTCAKSCSRRVSSLKSLTSAGEMLRTDLCTGWTVRAVGGAPAGRAPEIDPAEVPGCVHTDLMAAGVIPDPYLDGNEAALRWMYEVDWRYATVLDPGMVPLEPCGIVERVDLVFEGIDTIGTVRVGKDPEKIELG